MLRAITGYFFGGVVEEAPQATVECETREVNDWLVVNMADRPEDDIDMNDEVEMDLMTENEYDEILDAVSCLMRTDELENESFLDENFSEAEEINSQTSSKSDGSFWDDSEVYDRKVLLSNDEYESMRAEPLVQEINPEYNPLFLHDFNDLDAFMSFKISVSEFCSRFNPSNEVVQNFQTDDRTCFIARPKPATIKLVANAKNSFKYPLGTDGLLDYKKVVKVIRQCEALPVHHARVKAANFDALKLSKFHVPNAKEIVQKLKDCRAVVKTRIPDVTCQPLSTMTYVNHRNPTLPLKTDVMEKIKELEIEQQAQDYKMKKFNSKGQLNRQNKNYIFDSSCKKNRRKNLQRHPSGANNNRKC